MYAVIETGGKQYRVELGSELAVERLDATPGSTIDFDRVLLVADGDSAQVGTPTVADALVTADVVRQDRGEKLIVFKYRPKARHRAKKGHRQEQTVLRIADIRFNGRSAADEAGTQDRADAKARQQAGAEAAKKAAADEALAAKLAADTKATADAQAKTDAKTDANAKAAAPKPAAPKTATKPTAAESKKPAATKKSAEPKAAASKTATAAKKPAEPKTAAKPKTTTTARATRKTTKEE
jgi:large subunit ribosomal protein L21